MSEKEIIKEDEIDLIELARVIWSKRIFIAKVTGVFFAFGLVIAFTAKVEYEASCKLLPESQEGGRDLGGLGGLAGLAGFDLGELSAGNGMLTPELYPEIVKSVPFVDTLFKSPIYFEKLGTATSSYEYFKNIDRRSLFEIIREYTIGLPGKVKKLFSSPENISPTNRGMVRFSKEDWELLEAYSDRLSVSVNTKTGIILVKTEMPDPIASAEITNILVEELTQSITKYKVEKAQVNLNFVQERFLEAKKEYQQKQEVLARFTDRNRNISNSLIQTEYERLQNEMDIAFEVYKGLATQLEQAKIKVKEETPVFTILEPVRIPEQKSKPKRIIMIVVFSLLGLVLSASWIFVKSRPNNE